MKSKLTLDEKRQYVAEVEDYKLQNNCTMDVAFEATHKNASQLNRYRKEIKLADFGPEESHEFPVTDVSLDRPTRAYKKRTTQAPSNGNGAGKVCVLIGTPTEIVGILKQL